MKETIEQKMEKEIALKMRIEKIYNFLQNCNNEKIIYKVEKIISERRKIQSK